ncbi:MAG: VTT domain-containing protein [Candidatus Pacearchaeota archaeon]
MKRGRIRAYIGILLIVVLFILASYYANKNIDYLKNSISESYLGMLIYFLLVSLEIIIAPTSLVPFIPIASAIWGSFTAFMLTWIGWTFGSIIAFLIARGVGVPLLEKIVYLHDFERVRRLIPEKNLFLGVLIIRLFIPFDIMSYAISLFTKINLKKYTLATLIGYAPITFVLTYFGDISTQVWVILGLIGIALLLILILFHKKVKSMLVRLFKE